MQDKLSDCNYARPDHYYKYPIVLKSANGCTITDASGEDYLDFNSVMGTVSCGHNIPCINDRLIKQINTIWNTNFLPSEIQLEAISKIDSILPQNINVAALYSTGAEAIELALRIAREVTGRKRVLSFKDHFHGKTHGTMHLLQHFPDCYGPAPDSYRTVIDSDGSDDPEIIEEYLNSLPVDDLAAVIFEPVIGYSGPRNLHRDFLKIIRNFCNKNDVVMIADEILTGFSSLQRVGFFLARAKLNLMLLFLAKGLEMGIHCQE